VVAVAVPAIVLEAVMVELVVEVVVPLV